MLSSDKQGSLTPFVAFRRSIVTARSDQIHFMESRHLWNSQDSGMESFQNQVFTQFHDLSVANADEFLSFSWIQKLLDAYTSCQDEFKIILCNNKANLSKPLVDKLLSEFFDRTIKALDICNASRDGIEKIRQWHKNLDIVLGALDCRQRMIGEGQFRRARKALMDLALLMLDDAKEKGSMFSHRNRSFGRGNKNKDHHCRQSGHSGHSRSLSWSVPDSWSASKQLQSIANNLVPPRGNEIVTTNGLASIVFTMSFVLMFVLWALVAALPCQDRGHQFHFTIPRQFSWSTPFLLIHSRITDESKKQERRNSNGLLKEVYQIEKYIHHMTNLVDSAQFPLEEELKEEVREAVQDLSLVCEVCKNAIDPLDCQLRKVFHKIISCRNKTLEILGRAIEA